MVRKVGLLANIAPHRQKVVVFLLIAFIGVTMACGGYKIKVKKVQNCAGPDAVITAHENYTVVLTKNCEIKSRGCVTFKSFKTATATYTIKKNGVQMMQGEMDLCDQISTGRQNQNIAPMMRTFNLPDKCPVEEGTLCTDPTQVLNIEPYKQFLSLARGTIDVNTDIQHDSMAHL